MDKHELLRFQSADENTIPCRICANAIKSGICKDFCAVYRTKPRDAYFESAPCLKYLAGIDLVP